MVVAMFDHFRTNVLISLLLEERRREAERARRLAAAPRRPGAGSRLLAAFGGLMIRTGHWLQQLASPQPGMFPDPCVGCAN